MPKLRRLLEHDGPVDWIASTLRASAVASGKPFECPQGTIRLVDEMHEKLTILADELEAPMLCKHHGSEYGNCWDCRNTGVIVQCQEDEDVLELVKQLRKVAKHFRGDE